jgi:hypothetical protein
MHSTPVSQPATGTAPLTENMVAWFVLSDKAALEMCGYASLFIIKNHEKRSPPRALRRMKELQ